MKNQRSFLGQLVLAILILAFAAGCDSMARKPQTIEEGLYASAKYGETLTHSLNDARRQGAITTEQHMGALDVLQETHDGLQAGLDAYRLGNYSEAQNRLDVAEAALRSIALLVERYGEPE